MPILAKDILPCAITLFFSYSKQFLLYQCDSLSFLCLPLMGHAQFS